jgi:hypothetical protein
LDTSDDQPEQQNALVRWKYTWHGRLTWALVDLVIAGIFGSLAINSGTLWQWGVAVLFLLNGIYNLVRFIGKVSHGSKNSDEHTS